MVIVNACDDALAGKPYSGNLSLRFDEGSGLNIHSYSTKKLHFSAPLRLCVKIVTPIFIETPPPAGEISFSCKSYS